MRDAGAGGSVDGGARPGSVSTSGILERATQANAVGRLATLVPAFTNLAADRPVGLLEAGASAGLCLFPDRWSYRWDTDTGPVALPTPGPTLALSLIHI